jgi:hypothetical protein
MLALTAAGVLALAGAGTALAAPTTYTLSGEGSDSFAFDPDSFTLGVTVDASLTKKVASGKLETHSRPMGGPENNEFEFSGSVSCMKIEKKGTRVVVGAYGTVFEDTVVQPESHKLTGKYAQVLTVEFGNFKDPDEPTQTVTDSFGVVGENLDGIKSTEAPNCKKANFTHQILPTNEGVIKLTETK